MVFCGPTVRRTLARKLLRNDDTPTPAHSPTKKAMKISRTEPTEMNESAKTLLYAQLLSVLLTAWIIK